MVAQPVHLLRPELGGDHRARLDALEQGRRPARASPQPLEREIASLTREVRVAIGDQPSDGDIIARCERLEHGTLLARRARRLEELPAERQALRARLGEAHRELQGRHAGFEGSQLVRHALHEPRPRFLDLAHAARIELPSRDEAQRRCRDAILAVGEQAAQGCARCRGLALAERLHATREAIEHREARLERSAIRDSSK